MARTIRTNANSSEGESSRRDFLKGATTVAASLVVRRRCAPSPLACCPR